jgi:hypothetical protein
MNAPTYTVKTISGWQRDVVSDGWEAQLRNITGYNAAQLQGTRGENLVILFDEAQDSYWDRSLWVDFLKSLEPGNGPIVILFASYGSDSSIPVDSRSSVETRIPLNLDSDQRIGLSRSPWTGLGLLMDDEECKDLIKRKLKISPEKPVFDSRLREYLITISGGHFGHSHHW